jgi:4-hydroxybenzoate decarboxylase subunit C
MNDLREFLAALRAEGDLVEVEAEVDADLEIPEIHRRVIAAGGPALLFRRVEGLRPSRSSRTSSATRGEDRPRVRPASRRLRRRGRAPADGAPSAEPRKALGLRRPLRPRRCVGMKEVRRAAGRRGRRREPDLACLPAVRVGARTAGASSRCRWCTRSTPSTAARTSACTARSSSSGNELGMHVQIHRAAAITCTRPSCAARRSRSTSILGGPPALILAAIAPLPENVPELLLASARPRPAARHGAPSVDADSARRRGRVGLVGASSPARGAPRARSATTTATTR